MNRVLSYFIGGIYVSPILDLPRYAVDASLEKICIEHYKNFFSLDVAVWGPIVVVREGLYMFNTVAFYIADCVENVYEVNGPVFKPNVEKEREIFMYGREWWTTYVRATL